MERRTESIRSLYDPSRESRYKRERSRDHFRSRESRSERDVDTRDRSRSRESRSERSSSREHDRSRSRNKIGSDRGSSPNRVRSEGEFNGRKSVDYKSLESRVWKESDQHTKQNHRSKHDINERSENISVKPRLRSFCKLLAHERNRHVDHHSDDRKSTASVVVVEAKMSLQGNVVVDKFSRGIKTDIISNRDLPYCCNECQKSFMMATQLQDHLQNAHNIIRHASLIKPNNKSSVKEEEDDDNDEDDF